MESSHNLDTVWSISPVLLVWFSSLEARLLHISRLAKNVVKPLKKKITFTNWNFPRNPWMDGDGRKGRATLITARWISHVTLLPYSTRTCQLTPQNTTKQTRRPRFVNYMCVHSSDTSGALCRDGRVKRGRNCGDWSTWFFKNIFIHLFLMWRALWHHVRTMFPNTSQRVQVMVWWCVQAKPELSTCRVYLFWLSYSQSNYKLCRSEPEVHKSTRVTAPVPQISK